MPKVYSTGTGVLLPGDELAHRRAARIGHIQDAARTKYQGFRLAPQGKERVAGDGAPWSELAYCAVPQVGHEQIADSVESQAIREMQSDERGNGRGAPDQEFGHRIVGFVRNVQVADRVEAEKRARLSRSYTWCWRWCSRGQT